MTTKEELEEIQRLVHGLRTRLSALSNGLEYEADRWLLRASMGEASTHLKQAESYLTEALEWQS